MATRIHLNLVNHSNDSNNSSILIFQKNAPSVFGELPVAWTVIQNCGIGDNHPFTYSSGIGVGAADSYGNFTPRILAEYGQSFEMVKSTSGDILQFFGEASDPEEVEIRNNLQQGAITANCYRDGKLCAIKSGVVPGQKAVFQFRPSIWIGVVSEVEQGEVINSAIMSDVNTEISLLGIASADIVMTGGGSGPHAKPFQFSLQNVEYA